MATNTIFVGRTFTNQWGGYDITLTSDDLNTLSSNLDANNIVKIRISLGKTSGKPYCAINNWRPDKSAGKQEDKAASEQPAKGKQPDDDNVPF